MPLYFLLIIVLLGCTSNNAQFSVANAEVIDDDSDSKTVKIGGIDWYVDYDAALKVAKEKNLPVWLHFGENPG